MTPRGRRGKSEPVRIPPDLIGPVDVALARSVEDIPGPNALPGGSRYEPKWDGYRAVLVRRGDGARLWSRNGNELTASFPDVTAAAVRQLDEGVVLDGELVIEINGRLSFDALQRRLVTAPAKARHLVRTQPASYMAFDLLANVGVDLRHMRWIMRHKNLESLASRWMLPLQLSPVTDDFAEAKDWFEILPAARGIEGLVVKGAASRYHGGKREWLKINSAGVPSVRFAVGRVLCLVSVVRGVLSLCATGVADGQRRDGGACSGACRAGVLKPGDLLGLFLEPAESPSRPAIVAAAACGRRRSLVRISVAPGVAKATTRSLQRLSVMHQSRRCRDRRAGR